MKSIFALAAGVVLALPALHAEEKKPFHLVVMDPLALELSCPCVKGYAQRNYNKLGKLLEDKLGRPVKVHFSESLSSALKKSGGEADLIIGKDSVVRNDAHGAKVEVSAVAALTGKDGKTTQTGLFLVASKDAALSVADLKGYRIIFGPGHCDEKHKAALALLKEFKVTFEVLADKKVETCSGCDEGATTILDLSKNGVKAATVISSYAHPLLEGCGTVKKGDLRIIGETETVPFVVAFVAGRVNESDRETVTSALLAVGKNAELCTALETKNGFVPIETKKKVIAELPAQPADWTGWRGPTRDGRTSWLPDQLPSKPRIIWEFKLGSKGLGGVAATRDRVFVSERELNETVDVFKCLSAKDGKELWALRCPAAGELDFGTSSRATPLIYKDVVIFFGAFGHLHGVEIESGKLLWQIDIRDEFGADDLRKWGMCSSPLIVDDKLIVNPGAKKASLVALDPRTANVIWKTPGEPAGYGSFLAGTFGGKSQIVGYDLNSLGGWEVATGKRLWKLVPPRPNDFNVPTPLQFGELLLVTTENNGTRLYRFKKGGEIDPNPVALNDDLVPDSHTPVVVGDRLFGVWNRLCCLDLKHGLKTIWAGQDDAFRNYCSIISGGDRLLVTTLDGELILVDAKADKLKILGRQKLFEEDRGVYSHPAIVGSRLYVRGNSALVCVELKD